MFRVLILALIVILAQSCDSPEPANQPKPVAERSDPGDVATEDTGIGVEYRPDTASPSGDSLLVHADGSAIRLGYIRSVVILDKLPAIDRADKKVQQFAMQLDKEIKRRTAELQNTYVRYAKDTNVTKALMETRMLELEQMQRNLASSQYNAEKELVKKREALYQPILDRIDAAIKTVAKREGFTHVLDASTGSLVYGEDRFDITGMVLDVLGL